MPKIKLRLQRVSDAKRFFEILNSPNFTYFNVKPKSIEDEKNWLKQNSKRRKNNTEWNYTILFDDEIVGAIGIKIDYHRNYIGEIGYFVDDKFWGKGIATKAVKLAENICFKQLNLKRIQIIVHPKNKASKKVAIKNKYLKEGLLRKTIQGRSGKMEDRYLYAKAL
ncbi:GNAT family N-acetyltransferase [Patescibacteria group bacterium]|nr:GNAT family N-acetyltransferase [Patescibacteria group bacterium]MBU1931440.1 GNAT family N-acetyltransferase [Patescibacteria group bacterium]